MTNLRAIPPIAATALALVLTGCGAQQSSAPAPGQTTSASAAAPTTAAAQTAAVAPSTAEASEQGSAGPSPSDTATPAASEGAVTAGALTQTFTTQDGTASFRYPANWTVAPSATSTPEYRTWDVRDARGAKVLMLSLRPDGGIASPAIPTHETTLGTLPGARDAHGNPLRIAAGPFPGQAPGVNMAVVYGITPAAGSGGIFGFVPRGDGTMVSFEGTHEGGPNDTVDMDAETREFLSGERFRQGILPVLQSFTMTPAAGGSASSQASAPTTTPSPLRSATANPGRHEPRDMPGATSSTQEP
ncbi:hypothetical protein [Kocuria marina]|uniref:hypothetical protein n=1 Tax=Kocuria marina TaxID=223184 RepID=UPI0012EB8DE9|nr:hypothetical protein [Kocuria marina]